MTLKKLIIPIVIIATFLKANNYNKNLRFSVPGVILDGILHVESHKKNGKPYPFVIRINKSKDALSAKRIMHGKNIGWISEKIIDCKDKKTCIKTVKELVHNNIKNIDLGAYQINYYYYPISNIEDYFDMKKEREHAHRILKELILSHGYSWESIARYHTGRKKSNKKYALKLYKYVYGARR